MKPIHAPVAAPPASRCGAPVPGGHCTAPAPAAVAVREPYDPPAPYDRFVWERAVLNSSLHPNAKLVALTLAHHAGDAGYLPAGGPQDAGKLEGATGLRGRHVRLSLTQLQLRRFITRPDIATWHQDGVSPVTLTLPTARPSEFAAATRTEPDHPGQAAS